MSMLNKILDKAKAIRRRAAEGKKEKERRHNKLKEKRNAEWLDIFEKYVFQEDTGLLTKRARDCPNALNESIAVLTAIKIVGDDAKKRELFNRAVAENEAILFMLSY